MLRKSLGGVVRTVGSMLDSMGAGLQARMADVETCESLCYGRYSWMPFVRLLERVNGRPLLLLAAELVQAACPSDVLVVAIRVEISAAHTPGLSMQ